MMYPTQQTAQGWHYRFSCETGFFLHAVRAPLEAKLAALDKNFEKPTFEISFLLNYFSNNQLLLLNYFSVVFPKSNRSVFFDKVVRKRHSDYYECR